MYLSVDAGGFCACRAGSVAAGPKCVPAALYGGAVGALVLVLACAVWRGRRGGDAEEGSAEQRAVRRAVCELRRRLRIRRRDGFRLSTERPARLGRGAAAVIGALQAEAAAKLGLGREDCDAGLVDGFCQVLEEAGRGAEVRAWLLEVCRGLLNPHGAAGEAAAGEGSRRRRSSWWILEARRVSGTVAPGSSWAAGLSQEERFDYFKRKVRGLRALRVEGLFVEVKLVAHAFMAELGGMCEARYRCGGGDRNDVSGLSTGLLPLLVCICVFYFFLAFIFVFICWSVHARA